MTDDVKGLEMSQQQPTGVKSMLTKYQLGTRRKILDEESQSFEERAKPLNQQAFSLVSGCVVSGGSHQPAGSWLLGRSRMPP